MINPADPPKETTEGADRGAQKKRRRPRHWPNWITAIFTGLIFVATTAYAIVAGLQLSNMNQALTATKSLAGTAAIQAQAAKEANRIADKNIAAVIDSSRLDQRAWMGVARLASVPGKPEAGKSLGIRVTFKNTGKTPAKNIITTNIVDPVDTGQKPNFSYAKDPPVRHGFVPPGGEINATTAVKTTQSAGALTQELINVLKNGSVTMYVHGRLSYDDIFGFHHWITYCYSYQAPDFTAFGACQEHNDSD